MKWNKISTLVEGLSSKWILITTKVLNQLVCSRGEPIMTTCCFSQTCSTMVTMISNLKITLQRSLTYSDHKLSLHTMLNRVISILWWWCSLHAGSVWSRNETRQRRRHRIMNWSQHRLWRRQRNWPRIASRMEQSYLSLIVCTVLRVVVKSCKEF